MPRTASIVNVHEAKTQLSQLLARVERGETIVIARAGRPVAQLSAVSPTRREFGQVDLSFPDTALLAPLPDEELAAWE